MHWVQCHMYSVFTCPFLHAEEIKEDSLLLHRVQINMLKPAASVPHHSSPFISCTLQIYTKLSGSSRLTIVHDFYCQIWCRQFLMILHGSEILKICYPNTWVYLDNSC